MVKVTLPKVIDFIGQYFLTLGFVWCFEWTIQYYMGGESRFTTATYFVVFFVVAAIQFFSGSMFLSKKDDGNNRHASMTKTNDQIDEWSSPLTEEGLIDKAAGISLHRAETNNDDSLNDSNPLE